MTFPPQMCPDSEMPCWDCPCHKCAEWRQVLADKAREMSEDAEWERREQSRRVDAEYVNRRMPGGYKL